MLAMSILPILGENTLIYGTCDAGNQVVNSNEQFDRESRKLARALNLKTHNIKGKTIHTAVDCEGHLGIDGKFYMVFYVFYG